MQVILTLLFETGCRPKLLFGARLGPAGGCPFEASAVCQDLPFTTRLFLALVFLFWYALWALH
jgi:hypothetical protein